MVEFRLQKGAVLPKHKHRHEQTGYWGLHLRGAGGQGEVVGYHWNTGPQDPNIRSVSVPSATNCFFGHMVWLSGTVLYGHLFGSVTNSRGDVQALHAGAGTPYVGRGYSANYFNGDLAELRVYNRALSPSERAQVEQYLYDKWLRAAPSPSGTVILMR
jgi:hypothetical protein